MIGERSNGLSVYGRLIWFQEESKAKEPRTVRLYYPYSNILTALTALRL